MIIHRFSLMLSVTAIARLFSVYNRFDEAGGFGNG